MGKNYKKNIAKNDAKNEAKNDKNNAIKKSAKIKKMIRHQRVNEFKGRHFLLTINKLENFDYTMKYLMGLKSLRFISGTREVAPTTKKIHEHLYVQFKQTNELSLAGVMHCRVDPCFGDAFDNIAYIYKLHEPWKRGLVHLKIGEPSFFFSLKVKDIKKMSEKDIDEMPANLYPIARMIKKDYPETLKASEAFKSDLVVYYLYGESGAIKSGSMFKFIEERCGDYYERLSYNNSFWEGADGKCPNAVFDDFRDTRVPADEFIKFIDYNVQNMNIKGGKSANNYRKIFITSAFAPELIYQKEFEGEKRAQWLRRLRVFHFQYDDEEKQYFHHRVEAAAEFKLRPQGDYSHFRGVIFKKSNGELLTKEEEERVRPLVKDIDENFEPKDKDAFRKKSEEVKPSPVQEEEKPNVIVETEDSVEEDGVVFKKRIYKGPKKRIEFTEEELKAAVYAAITQPLDLLPKRNETILKMLVPENELREIKRDEGEDLMQEEDDDSVIEIMPKKTKIGEVKEDEEEI